MAIEHFVAYRSAMKVALVAAAKMVIVANGAVAVTDYPSIGRCERAKASFLEQISQEEAKQAPKGYHIVSTGISAVCIPV